MSNSPEQNCSHRVATECMELKLRARIARPDLTRSVACSDLSRPEEKCAIPVIVELARRSQKVEVIAPNNTIPQLAETAQS